MITFTDASRLAGTKLRTRKIRTGVTIFLASLLFGVLVAGSLIITGGLRSVDRFQADGLTSRYIVYVAESFDQDGTWEYRSDPKVVAEAKRRYEELVDKKTAEAKRLGVYYSHVMERPPYTQNNPGEPERIAFMDSNNITSDLLREKFGNQPALDEAKLEDIAKKYEAKSFFQAEQYSTKRGSSANAYPDGKEVFYDFSDPEEMEASYYGPAIPVSYISVAPPEIAAPFMLPNNANWQPDGKSLPIILPQDTVEKLLGVEPPSDKAGTSEKLEYLQKIREQAAGLSFQACYRNAASEALIQRALQQQKEIKKNTGNKEYQKPSLVYDLPDPATCQNPIVVSDTRTDAEKRQDENQAEFDRKFNADADPVSHFITFKVVGISPAGQGAEMPGQKEVPKMFASDVGDVLEKLLAVEGVGEVVPKNLYDQLSAEDKQSYADLFVFEPLYLVGKEDNITRFVEFSSASDAKRFIDEQGCELESDGECHPLEREYMVQLAFSNSAAIEDMRMKVTEWFNYGIIGVIALASIVMWITMGRTIADGRRETAVFRAIGFKRIDIATAYILYAIMLSILVALLAAGLGVAGAFAVHRYFAPDMTVQAQYIFGGIDLSKEVNLMGIDQRQLLLIFAACIAAGIIGSIIPLARNVRRSPIRDMRDEN